jgi:hypothetical protein
MPRELDVEVGPVAAPADSSSQSLRSRSSTWCRSSAREGVQLGLLRLVETTLSSQYSTRRQRVGLGAAWALRGRRLRSRLRSASRVEHRAGLVGAGHGRGGRGCGQRGEEGGEEGERCQHRPAAGAPIY